jgi:hypothetical protein
MSDIRVQFHSAFEVFPGAVVGKSRATIITELGSKVIFASALFAMVAHFSRRHSHEKSAATLDYFDVSHHKFIIHGN